MKKPVGIVGVGQLGLASAKNLLARGYKVVGYRRSSMTEFERAGGVAALSPADVARQCDIVITLLRPASAVEDVYMGEHGILSAIHPGLTAIELSTVPMSVKRKVSSAALDHGLDLLDGTISGNPNFIKSRTAAFFLGGRQAVFDRCAATLRDITDQVSLVGPLGAGRAAKFVALYLVAAHVLAAAEALQLAERMGLDKGAMLDAISGSNATSAMLESRGALMVEGDYEDYLPDKAVTKNADDSRPRGINSRLRQIQRLNEFASQIGGRYPLLNALTTTYQAAAESGLADHDIAQVIEFLKAEAGDIQDREHLEALIEKYS